MIDERSDVSSLRAGLTCRCPRCGEGQLFRGFLKLRDSCPKCGLDLSFADPADGPAFFVMTGVGILVITVWAWWAMTAQPPVWLQLALVVPTILSGSLATLRPMKAWLVAEQFVHKAEEGRIEHPGAHGDGGFTRDRRKASALAARDINDGDGQ